MFTLAAPSTFEQDAIAKLAESFRGDELDTLGQMLQQNLEALTKQYLSCCEIAYLLKTKFELAAASDDVKERKEGRAEKKYLLEQYGWTSHIISSFGKFGEWLLEINSYNLELLDIKTLEALCKDKFAPIINRLHNERLTVAEVREEMAEINKASKKPKQPRKAFDWKRDNNGNRRAIIELEADLGNEIELAFNQYGEPLPLFMREMLRRYKTSEVRLPLKSDEVVVVDKIDEVYIQEPAPRGDSLECLQINELVEKFQKVDKTISSFKKDGYDDESYVLLAAIQQKAQIILELRSLGVEAEVRT